MPGQLCQNLVIELCLLSAAAQHAERTFDKGGLTPTLTVRHLRQLRAFVSLLAVTHKTNLVKKIMKNRLRGRGLTRVFLRRSHYTLFFNNPFPRKFHKLEASAFAEAVIFFHYVTIRGGDSSPRKKNKAAAISLTISYTLSIGTQSRLDLISSHIISRLKIPPEGDALLLHGFIKPFCSVLPTQPQRCLAGCGDSQHPQGQPSALAVVIQYIQYYFIE